jgi:hypothetical protein
VGLRLLLMVLGIWPLSVAIVFVGSMGELADDAETVEKCGSRVVSGEGLAVCGGEVP